MPKCGCTTSTCHCCEGVSVLTPVSEYNRPGLGALTYRAGTHGSFFETMQARLAGYTVQGVEPDGQTMATFQPIAGLTTRDPSDPAIALLDSWATVADVLTFYQERIANEGFLRTATEHRSILELARLVGYTLRPGVSSSVYVAYTLDDNQTTPVTIPAGSRSQSIPGPGQMPQFFETSQDLYTRTEWNNLQIRQTQPQNITLGNSLQIGTIYLAGFSTGLKTGDLLLLSFAAGDLGAVARRVLSVDAQLLSNCTSINLQPVDASIWTTVPLLAQFVEAALALFPAVAAHALTPKAGANGKAMPHAAASDPNGINARAVNAGVQLLNDAYLEIYSDPGTWGKSMRYAADGTLSPALEAMVEALETAVANALKNLPDPGAGETFTTPSLFVPKLLEPPNLQPADTTLLARSLKVQLDKASDAHPQLLVTFAPSLDAVLYKAWAIANVKTNAAPLQALYAVRTAAPLFGSTVSRVPDSTKPVNQWIDWPIDSTESSATLYLDRPYQTILAGGLVMIQKPTSRGLARQVFQIKTAQTTPRSAYGISGNTTRIDVDRDWWSGSEDSMATLRGTYVYGQTEALTLIEEPLPADVSGATLELANLYKELVSGRYVILSGRRTDVGGVAGVTYSELIMLSGVIQGVNSDLPGDTVHTTLQLATPTAYTYDRSSLTIYANVVQATNGQTYNEVLGSGDATQAFAAFTLKQPPVTYVSDPNPSGVRSTIAVYVNNVQWQEKPTLAGASPKDNVFTTSTDASSKTTVIFGNGESGALPPTGVQNITAIYRSGIGAAGNVDANQISMLVSQPLGVKSVLNPLPATGGAGPESIAQARGNAPLAVMSLDRLVSVDDYANFTRTYAGIGKADAQRISDGHRQLVEITIAGAEDVPIDTTSQLYQNLLLALRNYGDPSLPVHVDVRELLILVLSANVSILSTYKWEIVSAAIRAIILDQFGFDQRNLGQPALLCEIVAAIQAVNGVVYVDVVGFGGIPEMKAAADGTRVLLTLDELGEAAQQVASAREIPRAVAANLAGFEKGGIRPAQLAIFTPDVPDTLILNQVL
jgi:predicted phage baseplate assembly protein